MNRLVVAVAFVALLTGCGAGTPLPASTAPPPSMSEYRNDTDVMFLQMLLAHHGPADEMLRLATERATREEVRTLAAAVRTTQADESRRMTEWLVGWNEPLISDAPADAHAAHGGLPPAGEVEIAALKEASSADFDRLFLNVFTGYQHHAVELARMEIAGGAHIEAVALADRVAHSRRAQIELMLRYLN